MPKYLVTYRPICMKPAGKTAIQAYGIPKYLDASCRREPDFENPFPSITALCRGRNFAPRLNVGDGIAYITKSGFYEGLDERHHRLTAMLEVIHRFESHEDAEKWYREQNTVLPSNCMVDGNGPLPMDKTGGISSAELKRRVRGMSDEEAVRIWDLAYKARVRANGVFLICKAVDPIRLDSPPPILEGDWKEWCEGVPGTQNPPRIEEPLWDKLRVRCRGLL